MPNPIIACCGLTCTDCPAYKATQANDEALARATADEWAVQFKVNVRVEDVWCDGCMVEGKKCAHCAECKIRGCALERGLPNCAHCTDFPCQELAVFFGMVPPAKTTLDEIRAGLPE